MPIKEFITDALHLPSDVIGYHVGRELAKMYEGREIIAGDSYSFDLDEYAREGLCHVVYETVIHNEINTDWNAKDEKLERTASNALVQVLWQNQLIDVLLLTFAREGYNTRHFWIVSDSRETAQDFMRAVCRWCDEVRGEILVFEGGCWQKDKDLYTAIKSATFDNLILPHELKEEIRTDIRRFFDARATYERYKLPWKRGVLLTGSPGNGKTHTIKALINELKIPCLYVKSLKSRYGEEGSMREVFRRARRTVPCLLVFEDLDSLVKGEHRSFFLNELDGFAENTGIFIIATTNHPEKLDSAITERPSRFDRKYHFPLPADAERLAYLERWNGELQTEMRAERKAVKRAVKATEGFSFAYLKELCLSAMMEWMNGGENKSHARMNKIINSRAASLRAQMSEANADTTNGKSVVKAKRKSAKG